MDYNIDAYRNSIKSKLKDRRILVMDVEDRPRHVEVQFTRLISREKIEADGGDWDKIVKLCKDDIANIENKFIFRKNWIIKYKSMILSYEALMVLAAAGDYFKWREIIPHG